LRAHLIELLIESVIRVVAVLIMKRPSTPCNQEMNGSAIIFGNDTTARIHGQPFKLPSCPRTLGGREILLSAFNREQIGKDLPRHRQRGSVAIASRLEHLLCLPLHPRGGIRRRTMPVVTPKYAVQTRYPIFLTVAPCAGEHIRKSAKQGNPGTARQIEAAHWTALARGEVGISGRQPVSTSFDWNFDRLQITGALFLADDSNLSKKHQDPPRRVLSEAEVTFPETAKAPQNSPPIAIPALSGYGCPFPCTGIASVQVPCRRFDVAGPQIIDAWACRIPFESDSHRLSHRCLRQAGQVFNATPHER